MKNDTKRNKYNKLNLEISIVINIIYCNVAHINIDYNIITILPPLKFYTISGIMKIIF